MGLFLSPNELRELTGRKRKQLQREQLDTQGIPYWIAADGSPRVLRDALASRIAPTRRRKPNFEALHGPTQKASSRPS